ncbi:MAG: FG-GAP repeat domain-containing protein, partial [Blastocatellia bacterium]
MMRGRIPRILLFIFFIGLIATPLVLKRIRTRSENKQSLAPQAAIARYGFHLEEVSKSCGIDFTHQAPKLDPKLDHIMPQVASMGAAVSVVDFDRDGWPDLHVTNSGEGSQNRLYRNLGNGQFKDVAPEMGIADVNRIGTGVS